MKRVIGLIIAVVGSLWMLDVIGIIDLSNIFVGNWKKLIWPGVLIFAGLSMLLGRDHRKSHYPEKSDNGMDKLPIPEMPEGEIPHLKAAFSGSSYNYNGKVFNGAKLDAFMGGLELDLRNAVITHDSTIEVHTFMGGVEVKVPSNIRIVTQSQCFMGGINNRTYQQVAQDSTILVLKANCMMGGIELRN